MVVNDATLASESCTRMMEARDLLPSVWLSMRLCLDNCKTPRISGQFRIAVSLGVSWGSQDPHATAYISVHCSMTRYPVISIASLYHIYFRTADHSTMAPSLTTNLSHDVSQSNNHRQDGLQPGIYVPTVAFFEPDEHQKVDVDATARHVQMLARAGVTGIVTHGSNGEAVHLDDDERMLITATTRQALTECGKNDMTIVVGCGAASTKQTIKLCLDAAKSGGDFALVLPPSYYGSLLTKKAISDYYRAVADASPIPIVIYNFPAVQGGSTLR